MLAALAEFLSFLRGAQLPRPFGGYKMCANPQEGAHLGHVYRGQPRRHVKASLSQSVSQLFVYPCVPCVPSRIPFVNNN